MAGSYHKAVVTEFKKKNEFRRDPSTLKFNTSYLKVLAFVQQINACISKSLVESQREGLDGIPTRGLLKAAIKSECMLSCGKNDNETDKPSRFTLERELNLDHSLITNYENFKKILEVAELARTKGAIV